MSHEKYFDVVQKLKMVSINVTNVFRNYDDLKYKHSNFSLLLKVIFNMLYTRFCPGLFFYASSTFFLFFSNSKQVQIKIHWNLVTKFTKRDKTKSSDQSHEGIFVREKDKYTASFFLFFQLSYHGKVCLFMVFGS